MLWNILILFILIVLSGFFSGTEVALLSVSKIKARALLKEKKKGAQALYKLKENPHRMIITILIGNNIVNIGAAALATVIAVDYFGSAGLGIATGIMTFVILVFGEITPKTFASMHAERLSLLVAKPILVMGYILYPVVVLFEAVTNGIRIVFNVKGEASLVTEEELKTMIEVSAEKDVINLKERELLKSVLEFGDISVEEVMTPKEKILSINEDSSMQEAIKQISRSKYSRKYSRIPLFSKSRYNITGVVHIRDILGSVGKKKKLKEIADEPVFVSYDMTLDKVFKLFQLKQTHMAIVVDFKRNLLGLVTLEDLMEEIVGEIMDEKDLTPSTIIRIDKHTIVVHGGTNIEKINKFLNISLPVDNGTIAELVKAKLKKTRIGSKLSTDEVIIIIDDIEDDKIIKIRIIKKKRFFEKLESNLK